MISTFPGYRRPDGRVGVRNHLVIVSTVVCANVVAERIAAQVPGAIAITHASGCAQLGADFGLTFSTLARTAAHPNVGAALVVGLGCEQVQGDALAEAVRRDATPCEYINIQELGGTTAAIAHGTAIALRLAEPLPGIQRTPCRVGGLVIGLECGSSDATSGIAANPVLGHFSDLVIDAGGTVILSEAAELMGAEHLLARRAVSPAVGKRIFEIVENVEVIARQMGVDLRGSQPTPGNMAGGISSIEEKSLGCVFKAGTAPVQSVVDFAKRPAGKGLHIMDTPGQDAESTTGMVAGGAQIVVFTTGRGTPLGNPVAPVVKVTGNAATARRMADHIDFSVEDLISGKASQSDLAKRLFGLVIEVAGGHLARAEALGHREFALHRIAQTI